MAKDKKVEQITDMEHDFAQWFTDVCTKAELVDYSGIKGLFILRPYGYAIWENIQKELDRMFKEGGERRFLVSVGGRYDWGIGYVGNWSFYFPAGIDAEEEVVYEV